MNNNGERKVHIQSNFSVEKSINELGSKPIETLTKKNIRRRGRPKRDENSLRTAGIYIYCNHDEKERIIKKYGTSADIRRKLLEDIDER